MISKFSPSRTHLAAMPYLPKKTTNFVSEVFTAGQPVGGQFGTCEPQPNDSTYHYRKDLHSGQKFACNRKREKCPF